MRLNQTTALQQNLKLGVTPKLIQSVHILQLSSADLIRYVEEQSSENPFLDVLWTEPMPTGRKKSQAKQTHHAAIGYLMERTANEPDSLEMMLAAQLRLLKLPPASYRIAKFLAGNLNENGLLVITLEEAAQHLQVQETEIAAALEILQSLEPAGIAARTLQECLRIQIRRDENADGLADRLVRSYLHELAAGKWRHLAHVLDVSQEQVRQSLAYIRSLNPRPGQAYFHQRQAHIKPDAVIHKEGDEYVIILNEAGMPKISLNKELQQRCFESDCRKTRDYVRERLQTAAWLIQTLDQRNQTLVRVIKAIAEEQLPFLHKGLSSLKPLNLKKIAAKLNLHESTISRTIQNKAVRTPQGVFELKSFFATGLGMADGDSASSETIKSRIRELIDGENKNKPLSDQQLTDNLTRAGFQISRRTVMKYREKMQILCSRLRGMESVN